MTKLTADDIVDLGRWHFIQFKDEATAASAMDKYRRFVERQRLLAGELPDTDWFDESVDDQDERAA